MSLIVQKYGGTSVGDVERIAAVAEKVAKSVKSGQKIIVVVSAMSGETNRLLDLASSFQSTRGPSVDALLSTGEQVSVALLCMALKQRNINK